MVDVITMGEVLIDFVPLKKGLPLKENEGFLRAPGGAPANVAVGAAKLGVDTAFFGKVGADAFGEFLIDTLAENGVNTDYIITTDEAKTCLAFVILDETGDRDFIFYRDPSADMLYRWDEVPVNVLNEAKIFHYGSISLINEPVRETTLKAARKAREHGLIVSYDPNLRMPLWPGEEEARYWIIEGLKKADLVKVSEEELEFITGEKDLRNGADKILEYGPKLLFVTLGSEGCYYYNSRFESMVSGYEVETEDTTGAGDGFMSAILSWFARENITDLAKVDKKELEKAVSLANAVGAITTTRKGAITALPDMAGVEAFMNNIK